MRFAVFAGLVYFVQATGSTGGIAGQTISFYCKEVLGWSSGTVAYFWGIVGIAWLWKPLIGLVSDLFPINGYRRKSYIYISNTLAILFWWYMGYASIQGMLTTFWSLAVPLALIGLQFCVTDIAADGLTVQKSQAAKNEGDLQAVQWGSIYTGLMLTTLAATWLAQWVIPDDVLGGSIIGCNLYFKLGVVFFIASVFPLINIISCYFLVQEEKVTFNSERVLITLKELFTALKDSKVWILMLCIFMLHFSPGFGTPLFYYIRDFCGSDGGQMPKMWFAWISMLDKIMALIGIILFRMYWRKMDTEKVLYFLVIVACLSTLCYLWVSNVYHIIVVSVLFGSFSGFIHVTFLTIAAQNTPKYVEGIIFAGYCAVFNLAGTASNFTGGWLIDKLDGDWLHNTWFLTSWIPGVSENMIGLRLLLVLSAGFTLITILFIPLLRGMIRR